MPIELAIPPSKSHTHRAILFAALARGVSTIRNPLRTPDTEAMLTAAVQCGAMVEEEEGLLRIAGNWRAPSGAIEAGNSGIVLRFMGALAALSDQVSVVRGDASMRPMAPLASALEQLGAQVTLDPFTVRGPLHPGIAVVDGADSQFVSALLIACSLGKGPFTLSVKNPGEKPWVQMTLDWLDFLGLPVSCDNYERYTLPGRSKIAPFTKTIPADFSSAAFPLVAALITGKELALTGLDMGDCQGDKKVIAILQAMGADITVGERIVVKKSRLVGQKIAINDCIDALPILAVAGAYAEGETVISGGAIARTKECDRIAATVCELKKMGADIEEREDGLVVRKSRLSGATLSTYADHRMAMALSVASLGASSPSSIENRAVVAKTYPTFFRDLDTLRL